jgi:glucose-1-phosphatase
MINIPSGTKVLLLDLGGVIIDLHMQRTFDAFDALGFKNFNTHFDSYSGSAFIENLEEGKISQDEFVEIVQQQCNQGTTAQQIIDAWNAMLGPVPDDKFNQLCEWQKEYKLIMYSNTNAIHVAHLNNYYNTQFGENIFQQLFDNIYYSHELGIRKPNKEGYLKIMEEQQLQANEMFYIEDGAMHIATAKALGINCLQWKMNEAY